MGSVKKALVCGAGGFIGGHLVTRLKREGYWVCGVDIKQHEFKKSDADEFILGDLRIPGFCRQITSDFHVDEIYQLAADMGGAGYLFTGENDADVLHNSAMINLNIAQAAKDSGIKKLLYSSSACVYPIHLQTDVDNAGLKEEYTYPAAPDSEYGWEKLFSERVYMCYARNYGLEVHIARFHNIFGPLGTWNGGREKVPAAICRKIAEVQEGEEIEIWGDGEQTRSFLYIDECLEGVRRLMNSHFQGPINIGSEEMVTINQLAETVMDIAGKNLVIRHSDGPQGVRGRNSDNELIFEKLKWKPTLPLRKGLETTYQWIQEQIEN